MYSQRRNLGDGIDAVDGPKALDQFPSDVESRALIEVPENDNSARTVLAPRADGLVRESKTQKVVSREEIQERTEVEDIKHLGDFSDEVGLFSSVLLFFVQNYSNAIHIGTHASIPASIIHSCESWHSRNATQQNQRIRAIIMKIVNFLEIVERSERCERIAKKEKRFAKLTVYKNMRQRRDEKRMNEWPAIMVA